ncbi:hypothetical protein HD806DRAFT_549197 [Xylariaceae sp. AK1471]|nr:hypothetical protein HD806DRAFT_549197 [Xylariaceae sp. AK1471]
MTFDDAVEALAAEEQYQAYAAETANKIVSLQQRAIAKKSTGQDVVFGWELPKTSLDKKDMSDLHNGVREVFLDRLFAFGFLGAYDFIKAGYTKEGLVPFHSDTAKMGVVWQVQLIWATQSLSLHAKEFSKNFVEGGMDWYMKDVAASALTGMVTDKNGKPTTRGGYLADAFFDVVAGEEITERP